MNLILVLVKDQFRMYKQKIINGMPLGLAGNIIVIAKKQS